MVTSGRLVCTFMKLHWISSLYCLFFFCAPFREESKIPGNQLVECHECHSLYHQVKQHLVYKLIKGVIIIHCVMCVIGSFIMRPTSFMLYILVCITDDIQPWLIESEKRGPGPCDLDLQRTQQIPGSAFFWISLQTDWSIKLLKSCHTAWGPE